MHIPDGYISPQTAGGLWALMVPVWYAAGTKVKKVLRARQAPLVAIGASFAFVIMMFNVPVPGGTSGHAVGGTLIAVALGPSAAIISLSVALVIQALFFGDGGILAIGANCFNMAFALPVTGYLLYRLLSAGSPPGGWRRWAAAGAGAYVGINVSAFLTAVEVGIQPSLFHTANGTALYSPYGLSQTIPAMMLVHATVIGFIETAVTALAVVYLQRAHIGLLGGAARQAAGALEGHFRLKPLIIGLILVLLFVPIGLIATATAWGEWSPAEIQHQLGYVPAGMKRFAGFWSGLIPHYGAGGGFWASVPGYLVSGAIGVAFAGGLTLLAIRLLQRQQVRSVTVPEPGDAIPQWMTGAGATRCSPCLTGRRRRQSAIERTIEGLAAALKTSVFSEQIAARPGLLQKADPRLKTAGLLVLLLAAALVRQPLLLLGLYAVTLLGAWTSKLSLKFFIRRVWLFIPIFAGIVVLPSIFNVVKSGDSLVTIWNFGHAVKAGPWSLGNSIAITRQGLAGAAILILRVAVSVSIAVLLTLTTRWSDLLKSLRIFYVPRIFVLILTMTYRYIFLLLRLASDMFTARRSRMVGPSNPREDRRFAAASMGTLLGKSHSLSDEIYAAMVSRGYNGEPMTLRRFRARTADWAVFAAAVATALVAWGADRALG